MADICRPSRSRSTSIFHFGTHVTSILASEYPSSPPDVSELTLRRTLPATPLSYTELYPMHATLQHIHTRAPTVLSPLLIYNIVGREVQGTGSRPSRRYGTAVLHVVDIAAMSLWGLQESRGPPLSCLLLSEVASIWPVHSQSHPESRSIGYSCHHHNMCSLIQLGEGDIWESLVLA